MSTPAAGPTSAEQALAALREAHAQQAAELARVRAELDGLLDASIEMSIQAEAGRSAELANKAKSEFLATISHEIRTPLHGILGNAELLMGTSLDPQQTECVRLLRSSAQALTTILNDVLDYSKIEAGRLTLEALPFDLAACVRDAVALFESVARDKGLALRATLPERMPPALVGDANRLRQVLLNLVANAVKFTAWGEIAITVEPVGPADEPAPSNVDIRAPLAWADQVAYRVAVQDTGIGIPAERVKQLFEPFQQLDTSMTRRFGGTGLGLAISQRLVQLMGGTIGVESIEGQGSRFHFTLTWATAQGEVAVPRAAGRWDENFSLTRPLSILLVEDNPTNQAVGLQMLAKLGYRAAIAADGEAAVAAQRRGRHELILMDIQMPVMDGVEATKQIRALADQPRPRIVALTANAGAGDRLQYLDTGMDDHLAKPFETGELADVIERAFRALEAERVRFQPPPLDDTVRSALRTQFGDAFLARLDQTFVRSAAPLVAGVRQALTEGNASALRQAAHTLRSSSANVGATVLSGLSQQLEQYGREGRMAQAASLLKSFDDAWEQTQNALGPTAT